ncbi:hypothetical protein STIUS_v1c00710 [Spiroplasma sp. TIUS-1]|uniref:phosphatase PAP2 family protein n=1 Tax=Spiroplasma sp. TIUS-1 TaxID=216963 RepID=UPI0013988186|nr:phosphatase PAP2 family protein [Spiroplasma sp. TIUS-1]QHX35626.1 hypothetical protein STIUS_v1c00710 [Spiroplasma sp. TIUS-1]
MNKELSKIKYSSFTTKTNKNNKLFQILWIATLNTVILLFIIGSIWDLKIAKAFGDLNDNGFISWLSMFWDKLAYTMTVPFIFAITGIFMETLNKKYGKQKITFSIIINIIYISFIIIFTILFAFTTKNMANSISIYGTGRSDWFGLDRIHTILVMSIEIGIEVIIMIGLALYLRLNFSRRNDLLTRNYWIDGIKVLVVFAVVGFIVDPSLKTFWGRPYFIHVDYQNVINSLPDNWTKPLPSDIHNAEYLDWWQIQGFNPDYWKAYFSGDYGNTHWNNVAFPSGHMNSSSMLVYTTILLLMNEKRGDKISWWKWLIFIIVVFDVFMMAIMQMVSRTHWITDLMFTLALLLLVFKPLNWLTDHIIYFVLSLIWIKTGSTKSMVEIEVKNKRVIFISIDNTYWQVAKVKISKIETSKKFKRWHSNNFKY